MLTLCSVHAVKFAFFMSESALKMFHIHRQIHRDVAVFRNLQMKVHTAHGQCGSVASVSCVTSNAHRHVCIEFVCVWVSIFVRFYVSFFSFSFSLVWPHSFQSHDSNSIVLTLTLYTAIKSNSVKKKERVKRRKRISEKWMNGCERCMRCGSM